MCEENVMSVSLAKLIAAFAKAKLEMGKLVATETAQVKSEKANYSYRYADLAGVLDVIDKPLASNGLVFVQSPVVDYRPPGATVTIHGTLYHDSGEYLKAAPLVMMSKETDPQKVGSAITYGRRYQAVAFFGLAQEDDDGKSAGDKPKQPTQTQRPQAPAPQTAQHRQAAPAANGNGHTNGATKPATSAPVITPAEVAATDAITLENVPEMRQDGNDNPFMPDAAQIHRITEGFNLPKDAWAWAAGNHYTENEHSARTRWATIVKEKFDNAYTPAKLPAIAREYVAYYLAKASAAQAA